jgi:hypothetical protein
MNDPTNDTTEQMMKTFADMAKSAIPTVNFSKNGYEIRSNVLEMAQTQTWNDYQAKLGQFATIAKEGNTLVTSVTMPAVPGADVVLKTAQAFYDFVNTNTRSKD